MAIAPWLKLCEVLLNGYTVGEFVWLGSARSEYNSVPASPDGVKALAQSTIVALGRDLEKMSIAIASGAPASPTSVAWS